MCCSTGLALLYDAKEKRSPTDFDASLLPPLLLVSLPALYLSYRLFSSFVLPSSSKPYDARTNPHGKGAPGFQTATRRVKIPEELAARIRAGEEVSGEEVTAALEREKERMRKEEEEEAGKAKLPAGVDAEWLPASALGGKNKSRKRK
ncbi:hypothetical protein JCM8547_004360 [Rhodosporidiobolus lusitaniae]